ncbi:MULTISPECIES: helix-turn-helix domain-containing protein [Pseudomonas]|jgi:transcriptional regulator with XRE-family HTH domain|uniref:Putative DNA-binding protein n=1 Tax=Pseudomonas brassicacearum (strain NFM421) TaxID=994484 RepID=F2KFW6_PSEBN|nr:MULTISPECIES: helix-turn-helix transcriptional regulator [Pseudomonas]KIR16217.1 helix-turn-helix protein [Pseudomonas fluorescens]AEA68862.1 Putative DNA-binding protein [Pseudomonas brassicacearum subsp. brassicacearum NFM421]AOS37823.1 transcriptional regulator [Pseudomonas brassicacearum]PJH88323.1 XRE family transcriptional regulator [Pseudomonas sp. WCS365]RDI07395.1 Xre family transcriptional regulator [Pseudomonas fluorescens]
MTQITQLISTLKQRLKAAGMTYRDVAQALDLSEPSVKRLLASGRLTLERLAQFCELLGLTMAELLQEAERSTPRLQMLTREQETQLVSNEKLLLVAVCALNHWSLEDIVSAYCVSKAECIKHLLVLERMGLADLKPGNRIRLLVARDFDWLPDGPIRGFFLQQGLPDFMASRFDVPDETLHFAHGMLTKPAYAQLQVDIHKLRSKLAALHNESLSAPLSEKRGTALLLAMRVWEPQVFRKLKRG